MPREVKALKWLVVDLLAAHVDELIELAGEALRALPPDARHALLGVARRKGCLDDAALGALVDETATALDVSGCGDAVTDAGVRALAARGALRGVVAADITSCRGITADGIRELVRGAPKLEVLRCGGDPACNAACRDAIAPTHPGGGVLPRLLDSRRRSLESWEALGEEDDDTTARGGAMASDGENIKVSAFGEGARALRWLVWPDVDRVSRGRVAQRCPRVRVIAPSPQVVAAANEAANDVHFVAVAGEGWIGWGASAGGGETSTSARRQRQTLPGTTGRSENNDGLVLVAAGHTGVGAKAGQPFDFGDSGCMDGGGNRESLRSAKWRSSTESDPWWYGARRDGDVDGPPRAADPTRALDHRFVRLVRRDVFSCGGDPEATPEGAPEPRRAGSSVLAGVAGGALRWRLKFAEDAEGAESVAARFARACAEVASARAARREKNYKKQRNRQRNKLGSAERHIWDAMNDVALTDGFSNGRDGRYR